ICDDTPNSSRKYNTVGKIKNADKKTASRYISRMKQGSIKDHLCKWIFETYHSKIKLTGNLTDRIKKISAKCVYEYIINDCFCGHRFEPEIETLFEDKTISVVKKLHSICPVLTGVFFDYLIRRLISEKLGKEFNDS